MELHQLRYFVAVAECSSFRRAAAQCHVAQPSLSQQIIKLEKELGHPLFDRLGRRIALTEAGRVLLPRARSVLTGVREIERDISEDIESGRGRLAVGAIPTVAPYLLPRALRRFARLYPQADVLVVEDLTESLLQRLASAELDLGLVALPIEHRQIETEALMSDPLLVACERSADLALASRVTLRDLSERPAVVLHEMHCLGEQIQAFCQGYGAQQRIVCRTTQLSTVLSLVALGLGVSVVPRTCAAADRSRQRAYRYLADATPERTIAAAWRRGRHRSKLARAFREQIQEECRRLAALDDARICR